MPDLNQTNLSLSQGDMLLSRYRLDKVLGQGGMGTVWLAFDQLTKTQVALKLLPAALTGDKRSIARLIDEANRNLQLTHEAIVRLHAVQQDPARGGLAFLVMQYIEGQTLDEILAEHPKGVPLEKALPWFQRIAQAIDFAHGKGLLHRDIKPANIIIERKTGTAYLSDFGIARETHDTITRITFGGQDSSGTLLYMSPQQLMGENTQSNDIYSFAITIYETLAGEPPFRSGDIAAQIRTVMPPGVAAIPDAANRALACALAKNAADRQTSAFDLVREIRGEQLRKDAGTFVRVPSQATQQANSDRSAVPAPAQATPRARTGTRWWFRAAVAAVLMIVALIAVDPLRPPGLEGGSSGGNGTTQPKPEDATRAAINALLAKSKKSQSVAQDLVNDVSWHEREVEPLMKNDLGKKLASDSTRVETVEKLLAKPRATREDAENLLKRITADFVVPLAVSLEQNPPAQPDSRFDVLIQQALDEAEAGRARYGELRLGFESLLAQTRAAPDSVAERTLAEAIEAAKQKRFAKQQAEDKEKAEEVAKRLEAERKQAEAAAAKRAEQLAREKAEADRLRSKARDPKILQRYSQFLGPGVYCLGSDNDRFAEWTYEIASPLRLREMRNHLLHENTLRFAAFGAKRNWSMIDNRAGMPNKPFSYPRDYCDYSENRRGGRWKYPETEAEVKEVQLRQREFFELAPYWVEAGLLRP